MDKILTVSASDIVAQAQLQSQNNELNKAKQLSERSVKSEAEMEKATKGFEALLLHQMLKAMWSTVQTNGLMGEDSNQGRMYRDMLNQAIADSVSEGEGIGVQQFLKKELLKSTKDAS